MTFGEHKWIYNHCNEGGKYWNESFWAWSADLTMQGARGLTSQKSKNIGEEKL